MADKSTTDEQAPLRPHTFDGIGEYDKKMPNWWLNLFYITLGFGVVYWLGMLKFSESTPQSRLAAAMEQIETIRLANNPNFDNATLWQMSRNATFVQEGQKTYATFCVTCHGPNLEGGIGENLADNKWLYGGNPMEVFHTIENGSPDKSKGMQAWGPTLGAKRIAEVVAFVMSRHEPPAQ